MYDRLCYELLLTLTVSIQILHTQHVFVLAVIKARKPFLKMTVCCRKYFLKLNKYLIVYA